MLNRKPQHNEVAPQVVQGDIGEQWPYQADMFIIYVYAHIYMYMYIHTYMYGTPPPRTSLLVYIIIDRDAANISEMCM